MPDEERQPRRTYVGRTAAAALLAAAAATALSVAPAAASAAVAPASRPPAAHSLTARDLMARHSPASAAARLARSPYALPTRASLHPATSTAGNLVTSLAVSATDVWAVGNTGGSAPAPLAEHYNGHSWRAVAMPSPKGSSDTNLLNLTALSASDIWAVGDYKNAAGDYATLSEHWNGTKWSVVSTPNAAGWPNNYLYAVAGSSASNVWAVGTSLSSNNMVNDTFVAHWNGTKWTAVKGPNPSSTYNELQGVYVGSTGKVLAVGSTATASSPVALLAERWNGTKWTQIATPLPAGDTDAAFAGLATVSGTSFWGYGWAQNSSNVIVSLTEHFNGTKWTFVASPDPAGAEGTLPAGAAVQSASDIWLVGGDLTTAGDGDTVTEHWNGTKWSVVASPNPAGATDSQLTGVAAASATSAWAVGETNPTGSFAVLRQHWNGKAWHTQQG